MHGRGLTICAWSSLASQEGFSNRPGCATAEHVAPTASTRGLSTLAEHFRASRDLARDKAVRNLRVSEDQRPATSHPRQPDDIFRFPPTTPCKFGPWPPRIDERCPVLGGCPCPGGPVSLEGTHEGDEHVGSHTGTSFLADSGHHTHSIAKPRLPSTPAAAQAALWWPKMSSGLQSLCRNKYCGSIRNNLSVGQQVKGAAARGPPCERNRACSGSVIVGSNLESLKCCSTFMETSRCHPRRVGPSHDLVRATDGLRLPIQTTMEVRCPRHPSLDVFKTRDWCEPAHFPNDSRCDKGVARFDHRKCDGVVEVTCSSGEFRWSRWVRSVGEVIAEANERVRREKPVSWATSQWDEVCFRESEVSKRKACSPFRSTVGFDRRSR